MTINYYSRLLFWEKNDILINIIHIIHFMQNVFFLDSKGGKVARFCKEEIQELQSLS